MTANLACRVFAEQLKLINQLPENERATVLYLAINDSFNRCGYQLDKQNGYQDGYQNESAYVSVSESLSEISKCVVELLRKNIVFKEFSNNHGGKREGSGSKKGKPNNPTGKNQWTDKPKEEKKVVVKSTKPTLEEVTSYCQERGNLVDPVKWFDYYSANGWKVGKNPMKDWKAAVRVWEQKMKQEQEEEKKVWIEVGHFYIEDDEKYSPGFSDLVVGMPQEKRDSLWEWFMSKFKHQDINLSLVRSVLLKSKENGWN